jgi:hemolysin activation/secretion protein
MKNLGYRNMQIFYIYFFFKEMESINKKYFVFKWVVMICILCFSFTINNLSFAQTTQDIEKATEEIKRLQQEEKIRQEKTLREMEEKIQKRKKGQIEVAPPKEEAKDLGEKKLWKIDKIILEGVTLLSEEEVKKIVAPFEGKFISLNDINELLNAIMKAYFVKGYVTTRAYIAPGQDLTKGELKIKVVEGVLEKIRLDDNRDNKSVNLNFVFPGMEGKVFNLRDVEQGLTQINRLPSNNAVIYIEPGSQPGSSILVVKNQAREPFTYTLGLDNHGFSSTGRSQTSLSIFIDNPLGLNDSLGFIFRCTPHLHRHDKYSTSFTTLYSLPYGYTTFSLSSTYSQYAIPIVLSSGDTIKLSGNTFSISGSADIVLYRDQFGWISAGSSLTFKSTNNYLADSRIDVSSYNWSVLTLGLNFNRMLLGGLLDAKLAYLMGINFKGAGQGDGAPEHYFKKYTLNLSYMRPFKLDGFGDITISTAFTGQYSNNVLIGDEQISIGGLYSVRGYESTIFSGDRGYYLQNELSITPFLLNNLFKKGNVSFFIGYDFGEISEHYGREGGTLNGLAYGVRVKFNNVSMEVMQTKPLDISGKTIDSHRWTYFSLSSTLEGVKLPGHEKSINIKGGWFIGLDYGTTTFKLNNAYTAGARYKKRNTEWHSGVSIGKQIGRTQIYTTIYNFPEPSTFDYKRYEISLDTKLMNGVLSPYAGISVGYVLYKEAGLRAKNPEFIIRSGPTIDDPYEDDINLKGLYYGIKLGILWGGKIFSANINYEYSRLHAHDTLYIDGVANRFEIKSISSINAGLTFRFSL